MSFYPDNIARLFSAPQRAGKAARANAVGTGASFVCGSVIRFYLEIDPSNREIRDARYQTNGCGFAIAAAESLAEKIVGQRLTGLGGLDHAALLAEIEDRLGRFPAGRAHCAGLAFEALQGSLRDFRARRIEEFAGEKALICTCFGVSEETVEQLIAARRAETVEAVGEVSNAGTGCGSCRFLIQELIDLGEPEN